MATMDSGSDYEMTDDQRLAMLEMQKLDAADEEEEDDPSTYGLGFPDYNMADRLKEINDQWDKEPLPDSQRQTLIEFRSELTDVYQPPEDDYEDDFHSEMDDGDQGGLSQGRGELSRAEDGQGSLPGKPLPSEQSGQSDDKRALSTDTDTHQSSNSPATSSSDLSVSDSSRSAEQQTSVDSRESAGSRESADSSGSEGRRGSEASSGSGGRRGSADSSESADSVQAADRMGSEDRRGSAGKRVSADRKGSVDSSDSSDSAEAADRRSVDSRSALTPPTTKSGPNDKLSASRDADDSSRSDPSSPEPHESQPRKHAHSRPGGGTGGDNSPEPGNGAPASPSKANGTDVSDKNPPISSDNRSDGDTSANKDKNEKADKSEEKILIELNGKFELVSIEELQAMGYPIPDDIQQNNGSQSDASYNQYARPNKCPDSSTRGSSQPPGQGQGERRRVQSAPLSESRRRQTDWDCSGYQSPYGLTPEQKEVRERRWKVMEERMRLAKKRKEEEERKKKEEAESAYQWWLSKKEEERRQQQQSDSQQSQEDEEKKKEENESAFLGWCETKRQQEKRERLLKYRERQEREDGFFLRSRQECDQAFRKWLKNKRKESLAVQPIGQARPGRGRRKIKAKTTSSTQAITLRL